jgi:hypothetical protein
MSKCASNCIEQQSLYQNHDRFRGDSEICEGLNGKSSDLRSRLKTNCVGNFKYRRKIPKTAIMSPISTAIHKYGTPSADKVKLVSSGNGLTIHKRRIKKDFMKNHNDNIRKNFKEPVGEIKTISSFST